MPRRRFGLVPALLAAALLLGAATIVLPAAGTTSTASEWCATHDSIVVLGDSGSTGWGLPGFPGGSVYSPTRDGWAARVSDRAAGTWATTTTVLAHNGAQSADFLPGGRFPDTTAAIGRLRELRPSLVIVELGGNDFIQDVDPANVFAQRYRRLIADVRAASARATVLQITGWEPGFRQPERPQHAYPAYTDTMASVARDTGDEMLDLQPKLPKDGAPGSAGLYLPDHVHLTPAGQHIVADAVWDKLRQSC